MVRVSEGAGRAPRVSAMLEMKDEPRSVLGGRAECFSSKEDTRGARNRMERGNVAR